MLHLICQIRIWVSSETMRYWKEYTLHSCTFFLKAIAFLSQITIIQIEYNSMLQNYFSLKCNGTLSVLFYVMIFKWFLIYIIAEQQHFGILSKG